MCDLKNEIGDIEDIEYINFNNKNLKKINYLLDKGYKVKYKFTCDVALSSTLSETILKLCLVKFVD